MDRVERLHAKVDRLAGQAPALGECVRGTVVERRTRCGKPTCACASDDERRHGPYHYLVITLGRGQTKSVFIPADLVSQVRRWSKNYARLKAIVEQVTEANCTLIAAECGKGRSRSGR